MRLITGFTGLVKSRVWVPQLARQGLGGKATNMGVGGKIGLGGKATRANPGPTDRVVLVGIGSASAEEAAASATNTKASILNFILPPKRSSPMRLPRPVGAIGLPRGPGCKSLKTGTKTVSLVRDVANSCSFKEGFVRRGDLKVQPHRLSLHQIGTLRKIRVVGQFPVSALIRH